MADLEPRIAPSGVWLAPPPAYDKIHGWEYMAHPLMFAYDPYLAAMLVPLFRAGAAAAPVLDLGCGVGAYAIALTALGHGERSRSR